VVSVVLHTERHQSRILVRKRPRIEIGGQELSADRGPDFPGMQMENGPNEVRALCLLKSLGFAGSDQSRGSTYKTYVMVCTYR